MRYCLLLFLFVSIAISAADSYRQIELKHRDAAGIEARLEPLLDDNTTIVDEGRSLLLRGPGVALNQLVAIIKKLDKPRTQLDIFVYRGADPVVNAPGANSPSHSDRWSTNGSISKEGKNYLDTVTIEEDAVLLITETELISLPTHTYVHKDTYGVYKEPLGSVKQQTLSDKGQQVSQARFQKNEIISQTHGYKLIPTLLADGNVSLVMTYSTPDAQLKLSHQQPSAQKRNLISKEISVTRVAKMDQWIRLSSHQSLSHRPALIKQRKVFSTQQKSDIEQSVWVKVTLKKPLKE